MPREQRNVFFALAQRRHEKRNHVEPVEKILAKIAARDFLFQILVGRGDHADVDRDRSRRSHRSEALFVERAQHLGLRLQAHVADFVEEERSAIGL